MITIIILTATVMIENNHLSHVSGNTTVCTHIYIIIIIHTSLDTCTADLHNTDRHMHTYTCIHTHTHIYAYIYIFIDKIIHTYIQTYSDKLYRHQIHIYSVYNYNYNNYCVCMYILIPHSLITLSTFFLTSM